VGVAFVVDRATYLTDVKQKLKGKHKSLHYVFSGMKYSKRNRTCCTNIFTKIPTLRFAL